MYLPLSRLVDVNEIYPEQYAIQRIKPSIRKHSIMIVIIDTIIHAIHLCTKINSFVSFFVYYIIYQLTTSTIGDKN